MYALALASTLSVAVATAPATFLRGNLHVKNLEVQDVVPRSMTNGLRDPFIEGLNLVELTSLQVGITSTASSVIADGAAVQFWWMAPASTIGNLTYAEVKANMTSFITTSAWTDKWGASSITYDALPYEYSCGTCERFEQSEIVHHVCQHRVTDSLGGVPAWSGTPLFSSALVSSGMVDAEHNASDAFPGCQAVAYRVACQVTYGGCVNGKRTKPCRNICDAMTSICGRSVFELARERAGKYLGTIEPYLDCSNDVYAQEPNTLDTPCFDLFESTESFRNVGSRKCPAAAVTSPSPSGGAPVPVPPLGDLVKDPAPAPSPTSPAPTGVSNGGSGTVSGNSFVNNFISSPGAVGGNVDTSLSAQLTSVQLVPTTAGTPVNPQTLAILPANPNEYREVIGRAFQEFTLGSSSLLGQLVDLFGLGPYLADGNIDQDIPTTNLWTPSDVCRFFGSSAATTIFTISSCAASRAAGTLSTSALGHGQSRSRVAVAMESLSGVVSRSVRHELAPGGPVSSVTVTLLLDLSTIPTTTTRRSSALRQSATNGISFVVRLDRAYLEASGEDPDAVAQEAADLLRQSLAKSDSTLSVAVTRTIGSNAQLQTPESESAAAPERVSRGSNGWWTSGLVFVIVVILLTCVFLLVALIVFVILRSSTPTTTLKVLPEVAMAPASVHGGMSTQMSNGGYNQFIGQSQNFA